MAETNPSDKGDRQNLEQIENAAPSTSDILQARNVSSEQVEAAWAANPDRSDGSATPRNRSLLAKQGESLRDFVDKQNASIELTERDEFGQEVVIAARVMQAKPSTNKQLIAYDLQDVQKQLNAGTKKIGTFLECSKQSLTSFEAGNPIYPHLGKEDNFVSYSACRLANSEYPELSKRIGVGKGHIDKHLIAATIRLEVAFYKQGVDTGQDKYVQEHGQDDCIGQTVSIGPAQMQIRHIERLVKEFPVQLGKFALDPLRAALKVENAPHFVGGYFAEVIQHLDRGTKPDYIGGLDWAGVKKFWSEGDLDAALIYAYNPKEDHVASVKNQLKTIQLKGF